MRLSDGAHLTYCTNIHPGEDLPSVRNALDEHVRHVRNLVCPGEPFGIGLRLSNLASEQLAQGHALAELRTWLRAHNSYVFTLNGFPYGAFHGARVKERVYDPDWRDPQRLIYTNRLADQLAVLLPEGVTGSVSSVPCAFKPSVTGPHDVERIVDLLLKHVEHLDALHARTGRAVALALEPEPGCYLETIEECVRFFETHLLGARRVPDDVLRRHLGVCVDTCHAAVEFEDVTQMFDALGRAGIGVKKLQLSAGLRLSRVDEATRTAVTAFADDVYLHQTVERTAQGLTRYLDLPDALRTQSPSDAEWRVHCHVPVFARRFGALESTQAFLLEVLERQRTTCISPHLEVETYTWDVLPPALRETDVNTAIARELRFVLDALQGNRAP